MVSLSLLDSRRAFEAWMATGKEIFQDLSEHHESLTAVYGHHLASELLDAEFRRRSSVLHLWNMQCTVYRNQRLSPLIRLPPEILREVLALASHEEHGQYWIKLGHVCSTMRNALHSCHTPWAESGLSRNVGRIDSRKYFLDRAGNVPLALTVNGRQGYASEHTLLHLHRAKTISISHLALSLKVIQRIGSAPAEHPQLECLDISRGWQSNTEDWVRAVEQLPRPISLPSLTTLCLANSTVLFASENLTELRMSDFIGTRMIYTPNEFLHALRGCPRLRVMKLKKSFPFLGFPPSSDNVVELGFLEYVKIESPREECVSLWTHLEVPTTAKVVVKMIYSTSSLVPEYHGPGMFDDAFLFRKHIGVAPKELRVEFDYEGHFTYIISSCMVPGVFQDTLTLEYLNPENAYNADVLDMTHTPDAIRQVRDALAIADVESLDLRVVPFRDKLLHAEHWRELLRLFPKVKKLTVDSCLQSLSEALTEDVGERMRKDDGFMPNLAHLCIDCQNSTLTMKLSNYLYGLFERRASLIGLPSIRTLSLEGLGEKATVDEVEQIRRRLRPVVPYLRVVYNKAVLA
ncbi:hypothetical protein PENSPDRAFT_491763 [Peniophora sp. CONT]|nr:hypothetical protein PENSPDRAFT_491763 [Peniophora sp. CONT]